MGQIDTPDIEVGAGGSEFVGTTPRQAVGRSGLETLSYKRHTAEAESKSLLEKFTGFERKAALLGDEDELITREKHMNDMLDASNGPGSNAFALGMQEKEQIKRARGELEKKKDAVDQGLLTYEQYRRDAETLFYQQVAMTPGLKDELAGAMSEYLGIDPRGQTAAIEIEKRKAEMKAGRDTLSTMRSSMQNLGLWDKWRTEEENFQMYSTTFKRRARAIGDLDFQKKQLEAAGALSEAQKKVSAQEMNGLLVEAQPQALASMSFFGQYNANTMTASDFINMPEADRLKWRVALQKQRDTFAGVGQQYKALLGDHFDPAPHQESIDARFDLIDGLLRGDMKEEMIAQRLKLMADENSYMIENEKNGILANNGVARRLAAISDIFPGEVLSKSIATANVATDLLMGRTPDLSEDDPEKAQETLRDFQFLLQNMSNKMPEVKSWTDDQINETGLMVMNMSKQQPDSLDHATRQQLFRVSGDKLYMDRLAGVNPRRHKILTDNIMRHQEVHNEGVTTKLDRAIRTAGLTVKTDSFFLKKEDEKWMLVPTSKVSEPKTLDLKDGTDSVVATRGQRSVDARNKRQTDGLANITASMNNARGAQWTDLIQSRANSLRVSEQEAARQIALTVGLSDKDVTPKGDATPERPGFGDEFKKTTDDGIDPNIKAIQDLAKETGASVKEITDFLTEQRKNDDFQPSIDGVRQIDANE